MVKQMFYLAKWFFGAKFFNQRKPLQSVIFISDKCNLACKHCNVYNYENPNIKTYEQIKEELIYCYEQGSRFIDFEGGEPFIWEDGEKRVDDLIDLAKSIGFYSCTITTNAQRPFVNSKADSIWVSLDGVGEYHEKIRGKGTFANLEKNIATCNHKALSVNMAINTLIAVFVLSRTQSKLPRFSLLRIDSANSRFLRVAISISRNSPLE